MRLILKKSFYRRNRDRELENNNFFNKIHKNITSLTNVAFAIILAPTIVVSSLLSQATFLMIANIFLSLGVISSFFYRIYRQEMSLLEAIVSLLCMLALFFAAFYFIPIAPGLGLLGIIGLTNLFSSSINSFFLLKNIVVPPLQLLFANIMRIFGWNLKADMVYKKPLNLQTDRHVLDKLLRKDCGYDSSSQRFQDKDITHFNNSLNLMCEYINKYQRAFLGSINNFDNIKSLESAVNKLITDGNTDGSTGFINKKLNFKVTKIQILVKVYSELQKEQNNSNSINNNFDVKKYSQYFTIFSHNKNLDKNDYLNKGKEALTNEIIKQNSKLNLFLSCLSDKESKDFIASNFTQYERQMLKFSSA